MKKIFFVSAVICLIVSLSAKESYFRFEVSSKEQLSSLTKIISISKIDGNTVYAYANDAEFTRFQSKHFVYEILPNPTIENPHMTSDITELREWDTYPSYETYVDFMYQFAADYPDICIVENFGTSVNGRELLIAKISNNVNTEEDEPEFLYTAQMHGNEIVGFMMMLHLIDYMLENYDSDAQITNLINNAEIWINPLANPDGTYAGGNNTVSEATRSNANGVDLNRNFKDPFVGDHPDGYAWQEETLAFMQLAEDNNFVLASNIHSGIEVLNYPWDGIQTRHADDEWWQDVCHTYADAAQANSPNGYMEAFDDGITNGYDWYTTSGSRQDYMNYFHGCREMTLELSDAQMLPASELDNHWDYNLESFLLYMEECLYGVRGIVTDSSGEPIDAILHIEDHDMYNTEVFTDSAIGDYHRMIYPGTYDFTFSAFGYETITFTDVTANHHDITTLHVTMTSIPSVTISGLISDGNTGLPISGAELVFPNSEYEPVVTNANGEFSMENIFVGDYQIRITVEGYNIFDQNISVSESNNYFEFEIDSIPIITISGLISDGDTGLSINGAELVLLNTDYEPVNTNASGQFIMENVYSGDYQIRITAEDYISVIQDISVSESSDYFEFELYVGTFESFETGEFDVLWTSNGNEDWFIDDSDSYDGIYSARSGNISSNETTTLSLSLDVTEESHITFYKKVSCEEDSNDNWDYMFFAIDNEEQARWDGFSDWSEETFVVSSGLHTFKWTYSKDGNVSEGEDCAWIDFVTFPVFTDASDDVTNIVLPTLIGNFPNPFNPSTTISFSLSQEDAKNTKLEIFNLKGQKVKTFDTKNYPKLAEGNVVWNGKDKSGNTVSSGVYFYKLQTGNYSQTKKMILIK
jgi:hypothetical protein